VAFLVIAALAIAPLAFGGCGSSGGSNPNPPPPSALAVAASPAGGNYSGTQNVALTATGEGSATAVIYYTTDLSVPTDTSTMYAGPIAIDTETVLKFYAAPTTGDPTDVVLEGYTFATGIGAAWAESGHGHIAAEAWRHWDEDGEVETSCAKCHSGDGFRDWAEDGTVDAAAALPYGLDCTGCHQFPNTLYGEIATYTALDHVEFPSGETVTMAGDSNMCISCHQGRASADTVDGATDNLVMQEPTNYESFDFINIHYYAAAASYFGSEVRGGYEYAGDKYVPRNTFGSHPDSLTTCTGCHMREDEADHTWFPDLNRCLECHDGNNFTTLSGSPGINYAAIQGALTQLFGLIETYADGLGYPLIYDDIAYPYFFNDNGAGANFGNRYRNFDRTLLQAAYNYQFGLKEPCGYIHNGIYMRQILHDSIVDLGGTPLDVPPDRTGYTAPANMFAAVTNQWRLSGHADAAGEPFRHWDEDPAPQVVDAGCARCHSSPGYEGWRVDGTETVTPAPVSTVGCIACHAQADLYDSVDTAWDDLANTALRPVEFPSGLTGDLANSSNVCMGCHQGRSSGPDVEQTIIDDAPGPYTFINIHYYPAAATFFGTDVKGGVQYRADGSYRGQNPFSNHSGAFDTCIECHMIDGDHTFEPPALTNCAPCHGNPPAGWKADFGGTPGTNYTEIQSLLTDLYAAIQDYATNTIGTGIFYDSGAYPYFFTEGGLAIFPNRYVLFDATLLRAAYNYQMGQKDPCAYLHNGIYMRQLLYDALDDLDDGTQNGSVAGHSRP
jgi:hypothetical protein